MKITEAGILKRIEFVNEQAKERYLMNLRVDGKNFKILGTDIVYEPNQKEKIVLLIIESWRDSKLFKMDIWL